jgi:hypothetical protein
MEATVMSMINRKSPAEFLSGELRVPVTPPTEGYIKLISFLDERGHLASGSIPTALNRCGIPAIDQDGRKFGFRASGLFAKGEVSADARELLDLLADLGFSGSMHYLVKANDHESYEHEMILQDGFCTSSEDTYALARAYG